MNLRWLIVAGVGLVIVALSVIAARKPFISPGESRLFHAVNGLPDWLFWPLTFTLQGDLASWTPRLQAFVPLGDWRMAGAVDASGSGRFSPTAVELAATTVRIEQLAIDGPNVAIHEPIVKIDTTKLDYVEDLVDLIELQQKLDKALGAPKK